MKVLKRATNNNVSFCHVTNYQQLAIGRGERQSGDSENNQRTDREPLKNFC